MNVKIRQRSYKVQDFKREDTAPLMDNFHKIH